MKFLNQVVDECISTNDLAKELGQGGAVSGSWVSAKRQSAGRGRAGRNWQSLEGNLFLSMVIREEQRRLWTWVPLAAAFFTAKYLRNVHSSLSVRIKWPNDIWGFEQKNGAKVAGFLCESSATRDNSFLVVGMGLNLIRAPDVPEIDTTSLRDLGLDVDLSDLREGIVDAWRNGFRTLEASMSEVRAGYEALALFQPGTQVTWKNAPTSSDPQVGEVVGLGEFGQLLVKIQTSEGRVEKTLLAEDVFLLRTRKD